MKFVKKSTNNLLDGNKISLEGIFPRFRGKSVISVTIWAIVAYFSEKQGGNLLSADQSVQLGEPVKATTFHILFYK